MNQEQVKQLFATSPDPIIGIAGTVGKRTIAELLRLMHVGNYIILPLEAWQLEGLEQSPQVAIMTAIAPENPQYYGVTAAYLAVLENLTKWQHGNDLCFYDGKSDASWKLAVRSAASEQAVPSDEGVHIVVTGDDIVEPRRRWLYRGEEQLADISAIRLLPHDWTNALFACAAALGVGTPIESVLEGLTNYQRLPEHMQPIREFKGEKYYNDAASTTPLAGLAALNSILGPKIMIFGGEDVGLDYNELALACAKPEQQIKRVVLTGPLAPRLEQAFLTARLAEVVSLPTAPMSEVLEAASIYADPGDTVILSPAAPNNFSADYNAAVGALV